jgi:hypothetical protein
MVAHRMEADEILAGRRRTKAPALWGAENDWKCRETSKIPVKERSCDINLASVGIFVPAALRARSSIYAWEDRNGERSAGIIGSSSSILRFRGTKNRFNCLYECGTMVRCLFCCESYSSEKQRREHSRGRRYFTVWMISVSKI